MSGINYHAKGEADFIHGRNKDEALFHGSDDRGRLYREGWHHARRMAPGRCDSCSPEFGHCWATGYDCRHHGNAEPSNVVPFINSPAGEAGPKAAEPAAVPVGEVKTPTPPTSPRERPKDGAPAGAGWQGFESGHWHFFDKGARKSVCKRCVRAVGPVHATPDGLVCSLCDEAKSTAAQLDLF